jgi:hypothetical protein
MRCSVICFETVNLYIQYFLYICTNEKFQRTQFVWKVRVLHNGVFHLGVSVVSCSVGEMCPSSALLPIICDIADYCILTE